MFQFCRKIVAGPKKKLQWNGKQLDLTYVTDRIIAMAYPASGLQKAYRNSIKDVANYFQEKHGDNYMIVNVSSRKYDYKYFNNNVLQFEWRDHLSPPLSTLFEIGRNIYEYLKKNKKNVVAVHCNHGKGRTGTTIIAFLMFTGFFENFNEALQFYNKRRFISLTYGVSQPCQKRYLNYFQILKSKQRINPKLITYKIRSIIQKGLQKDKYYIEISSIRNAQPKYKQLFFSENYKKLYPNVPLVGDICIQIYEDKWNGDSQVAMINYNTYFLLDSSNPSVLEQGEPNSAKKLTSASIFPIHKRQKFYGKQIKVNEKHPQDFEISIDFQLFCNCHLQGKENLECPCQVQRIPEQKIWRRTIENAEISRQISKLQSCSLLFNVQYLNQTQFETKQQEIKKLFIKNPSQQSSKGTLNSQISSKQYQMKQADHNEKHKWEFLSDKVSSGIEYENSHSSSLIESILTEDKYQKTQFQYDMVILNRKSTNSA